MRKAEAGRETGRQEIKQPLIHIEQLHKTFVVELHVLEGIDLDIQKGEMLAIVLEHAAPYPRCARPTDFGTYYGDVDVFSMDSSRIARFEQGGVRVRFHHLLPEFTAIENVMMPALIRRTGPRRRPRIPAEAILHDVGLGSRLRHQPESFPAASSSAWAVSTGAHSESPTSYLPMSQQVTLIRIREKRCMISFSRSTNSSITL